jgi:hypothetical protein
MRYLSAILLLFCVSSFGYTQDWESRAIVGWHQAGASSADSTQNFFYDFFVARPLGKADAVYENKYSLWGQVRVASSPQQRTIPLSQFAADFVNQIASVPVNELAQSAEFLTGVELRPWKGWSGTHTRTLGIVGFFGANGAFSDPTTQAQIFRVPPTTSPQWANFVSQFKEFGDPTFRSNATFLALLPPDRERFYRQYGFGVRYTSYVTAKVDQSPAMYTATLGQDQSITRGRYVGPVLKFDAFYPLPLSAASFIYLFGTANLAVAKPGNATPLALQLVSQPCTSTDPATAAGVTCGVKVYQDSVAVNTVASSRDTYRIGVGIDAIAFINTLLKKN